MASKTLKVAIISDLHCHPEKEALKDNNTYLFSAKLRSPANEHPVEDLLGIISRDNIEVDLVLSPGDITDQCDIQGFFSGWSYVIEISRALKSMDTIATVGNHDVDSRLKHSQYSLDIPKKISQNFPLSVAEVGTFWDKGFTFIEKEDYQILVFNSTHFHTHSTKEPTENPSVKGKVDSLQIEAIEKYLSCNNDDSKIKIFLCHHHIIKHSRLGMGEYDFIENGEDLLRIIGKYKFDLVIHGHKHDPWLRYVYTSSGSYQIPILSSGSFSATNQILWASIFNYFHVIEIEKQESGNCFGKILTYTFKNKSGWRKDREDGFLPYTGFGYQGNINDIVKKVESIIRGKQVVAWEKVLEAVPEINFLTPDQMEELEKQLSERKINVNSKIGLRPKHIYYEGD
ncbi:metallophosphoesterase family protein [Runella sp.]|uniref:metallophosphoesterase family protein n=1 Tax=Runella sp. TaxID=1960881 RepID=UPI003D11565B